MAGMIAGDIKKLLSIHIKPRHDSIPDQYSRIFMVKILLVCTIVIGVSQYKDSISCIIPEAIGICNTDNDPDPSCDFIQAACWIQGMYVYKELLERVNDVAYFGMPKNIDHDGIMNGTNELCSLEPKLGAKPSKDCVPMQKTFYLQYQWMTFFMAALSILYYIPYILFCKINHDLIVLRMNMKDERTKESEKIIRNYFNRSSNAKLEALVRPCLNIIVKILYICANFISFLSLDNVLNGEFMRYGKRWIDWSKLENTIMHDYMGTRDFPKPGNRLLPPFGYCEFYESAKDIKITKANKFKLVCEISQHVLYQYCLLLLWFCLVFGMIISILGLLNLLWGYFKRLITCKCPKFKKDSYQFLTLREIEYMEYIKKKDSVLYGDILTKLNDKSNC